MVLKAQRRLNATYWGRADFFIGPCDGHFSRDVQKALVRRPAATTAAVMPRFGASETRRDLGRPRTAARTASTPWGIELTGGWARQTWGDQNRFAYYRPVSVRLRRRSTPHRTGDPDPVGLRPAVTFRPGRHAVRAGQHRARPRAGPAGTARRPRAEGELQSARALRRGPVSASYDMGVLIGSRGVREAR